MQATIFPSNGALSKKEKTRQEKRDIVKGQNQIADDNNRQIIHLQWKKLLRDTIVAMHDIL